MLWQLTTLWGQPLIAAELWARPSSRLAPRHEFSRHWLLGGRQRHHRSSNSGKGGLRRPAAVGIALQALLLTCKNGDPDATRALYRLAEAHAATGEYSGAGANSLSRLREMLPRGECPGLERADLRALADRVDGQSTLCRFRSPARPPALHSIELYRDERDLDGTLRHCTPAYAADPDIGAIALIVGTLLSAGLHDEARTFLEQAQRDLPLNPVLRIGWRKIIGQLWEVVDGRQVEYPN